MISQTDIDALANRNVVAGSRVLSVYLDMDQGKPANLNRQFETALNSMLGSLAAGVNQEEQKDFSLDAKPARQFVAGLEPRAKGLIVFSDASENFFWSREIHVALRNRARWMDKPYLVPLLEILDEHERYGVVLLDKESARLFTVYLGEIEEHADAMAPASVRRYKASGTDHLLSESRFQHKAATHVHWHAKNVAQMLDKLVDQYALDRLLLGGPVEATSELQHLLSKRVRNRVVERLSLPVKANAQEVLQAALAVEERVEREMEKRIVDELIAGDPHHPSALGLDPTVRALCEERVWRLIYEQDFNARGGRCTNCGMLFARTEGSCDYCGAAIKPIHDLLEQMVERVLEQDGRVEKISGDAALRLQQAGGIGAVLRFGFSNRGD
jgi:peptide subunit release factor 1 (eRF1)